MTQIGDDLFTCQVIPQWFHWSRVQPVKRLIGTSRVEDEGYYVRIVIPSLEL